MNKRVIRAAIAALLIVVPARSWALTEPQLLKISEAVFATDDAAVRAAFLTLRQHKCLDADGKDGNIRQLITFHVLEANDPAVNAAFKLLVDRKVLGEAQAQPSSGPVGLAPVDLAAMERVRQALADCRREQSGLAAKFARLTQFGWVRERAELPGQISAELDTMGSFYVQAADQFKPLASRPDPAVAALGADVQRCEREMSGWYDRWNAYAQSNN